MSESKLSSSISPASSPDKAAPQSHNLEQLRKQAKDLIHAARSGDGSAITRIRIHQSTRRPELQLADAQHTLACELGFHSWPHLVQHIELQHATTAERAAALVRAAVGDDAPAFRALLSTHPELAAHDLATACVTGHLSRLTELLPRIPDINAPIPPLNLPPLLYVLRSNAWKDHEQRPTLRACANLLLDHGASPNVRYAFEPPYQSSHGTPLYLAAAIWSDEDTTQRLLDAGAHTNPPEESEALYHASEKNNLNILRLLLTCSTLAWRSYCLLHVLDREALPILHLFLEASIDLTHTHPKTGETALHWAIKRGRSRATIDALLAAGANPLTPDLAGTTPYLLAIRAAHLDAIAAIEACLTPSDLPPLSPADTAFKAAATGAPLPPGPLPFTREHESALVILTSLRKTQAVRALLAAGLSPTGTNEWGHTALHWACYLGRPDLATLLIAAGAPLALEEPEFHGTPANWTLYAAAHSPATILDNYAACLTALAQAGAPMPTQPCAISKLETIRAKYAPSPQPTTQEQKP